MKTADCDFLNVAQVRRALVAPGDVRGDVDFQNDINGLLARLVERAPSFEGVGGLALLPIVDLPAWLVPGLRPSPLGAPPSPGPLAFRSGGSPARSPRSDSASSRPPALGR